MVLATFAHICTLFRLMFSFQCFGATVILLLHYNNHRVSAQTAVMSVFMNAESKFKY